MMHAVDETELHPRPLVDPDAAEWERNYAQWTHLAGLIGGAVALFSAGVSQPFALVGVLVMWLVKRDQSPFVDDHGKEAVNFQISILIYILLTLPIGLMTCSIGWFVLPIAIAVLDIVGTIRGSQAASRGEFYRYPACIRLLQ
jgi:uncharacterized protein